MCQSYIVQADSAITCTWQEIVNGYDYLGWRSSDCCLTCYLLRRTVVLSSEDGISRFVRYLRKNWELKYKSQALCSAFYFVD
jgi:hypothetical protein